MFDPNPWQRYLQKNRGSTIPFEDLVYISLRPYFLQLIIEYDSFDVLIYYCAMMCHYTSSLVEYFSIPKNCLQRSVHYGAPHLMSQCINIVESTVPDFSTIHPAIITVAMYNNRHLSTKHYLAYKVLILCRPRDDQSTLVEYVCFLML